MRLIRLPQVLDRVALGRAAVYERVKAGTFPAPIKLGAASAWVEEELDGGIQGSLICLQFFGGIPFGITAGITASTALRWGSDRGSNPWFRRARRTARG